MLPLLRLLPPETAHRLTLKLLPMAANFYGNIANRKSPHGKISEKISEKISGEMSGDMSGKMTQELFGMSFFNPIGMAAGFDKNAAVARGIMKLGFGFLEVGTITPEPQPGNRPPRLFRLEHERAIINRLGFPSEGMLAVEKNLTRANQIEFAAYKKRTMMEDGINQSVDEAMKAVEKKWLGVEKNLQKDAAWLWPCPLFVNIGPNKNAEKPITDFATVAKKLSPLASGFVVNVSSPNTAGLRDLQKINNLKKIIDKLRRVAGKPVLLKISPDMTRQQVEEMAQWCVKEKIDGVVLTNSTIARNGVERSRYKNETGGLSGKPLFYMANRTLAQFYLASEKKIPLIGVGGIMTPEDVITKMRAGASLVEGYSGFIYHGRSLLTSAIDRLEDETSKIPLAELIGADAEEHAKY